MIVDKVIYFMILFLIFTLIFLFAPRILVNLLNKLLGFESYKRRGIYKRTKKLYFTYLYIGFALGIIFTLIFGLKKEIIEGVFGSPFLFSAIAGYLFIWVIRISTLSNKSIVIKRFMPRLYEMTLKNQNVIYNWEKQKNLIESFLFSTFLITILSGLIAALIKFFEITDLNTIIAWGFSFSIPEFVFAFICICIFLSSLFLFIYIGEFILEKVGVHDNFIINKTLKNLKFKKNKIISS